MNYKRKRKHSKVYCPICAGQRRRFGSGTEKTKAKLKIMDRELKDLL